MAKRMRAPLRLLAAAACTVAALAAAPSGGATAIPFVGRATVPSYRAFADPRPIVIRGYAGDAMEPFISADGRSLLFNNLNQTPVHTVLRWAKSVGPHTFDYRGAIAGANDPVALTAVPALSGRTLFFISSRSYARTRATVYRGRFTAARVRDVRRVPGVVAPRFGIVDFDVDVDAGGSALYVSEGRFGRGAGPAAARLVVFTRARTGSVRDPASGRLLAAVDRPGALTYAAAISADDRELFFTQAAIPGEVPSIYRAIRASTAAPFGDVQRVGAITGFAEAPSLSSDGRTLYYHRRVGRRFGIYFVTR
jgi:hypothetical protein